MLRLSWPGKSVVSRSFFVAIVMMTFLRTSPLLFRNQIAPVIDAATFTDFTLFQRSRPPCAFTARSNRLLIGTPCVISRFVVGRSLSARGCGEAYLQTSRSQMLLVKDQQGSLDISR